MAYKFVALFAFIAAVNAVAIPIHHGYGHANAGHVEYADAPAEYDFSYSVHDEHTGDIKSQHESRKGDAVHGSYELIESDGHKRIVEYTADDHHGFNAVVHREPTNIKVPVPAPTYHHAAPSYHQAAPAYHHAAPVYHQAAPVYHHSAPATVHYSHAPVAKVFTAAPIQKVYASAPASHYGGGHGYESNHVSFSAPTVNYHY